MIKQFGQIDLSDLWHFMGQAPGPVITQLRAGQLPGLHPLINWTANPDSHGMTLILGESEISDVLFTACIRRNFAVGSFYMIIMLYSFHITGLLWSEPTNHWWIPVTKGITLWSLVDLPHKLAVMQGLDVFFVVISLGDMTK